MRFQVGIKCVIFLCLTPFYWYQSFSLFLLCSTCETLHLLNFALYYFKPIYPSYYPTQFLLCSKTAAVVFHQYDILGSLGCD